MDRVNLKLIIGKFLTSKNVDDKNRPQWINEKYDNYNNGSWSVGRK